MAVKERISAGKQFSPTAEIISLRTSDPQLEKKNNLGLLCLLFFGALRVFSLTHPPNAQFWWWVRPRWHPRNVLRKKGSKNLITISLSKLTRSKVKRAVSQTCILSRSERLSDKTRPDLIRFLRSLGQFMFIDTDTRSMSDDHKTKRKRFKVQVVAFACFFFAKLSFFAAIYIFPLQQIIYLAAWDCRW